MAGKDGPPIIIKKIKKGGHGHHGGAWKVAYADFVTAMMAFFLLLWLLNSTEAEKLAGLADYFAPTVGIKDQMGIGFRGGKSALSEGIGADINTNKGIVFGGVPSGPIVKVPEKIEAKTEEADDQKIKVVVGGEEPTKKDATVETDEMLVEQIESVTESLNMQDAMDMVQTPEGIEIRIKDSASDSMFKLGTDQLEQRIKDILIKLAPIVQDLPNYIAITGHTSAVPLETTKKDYSNWELSSDRANSVRRFLISQGVSKGHFVRITGKSDQEPITPDRPEAPENNRVTLVIISSEKIAKHQKGAPDEIFVDHKSKEIDDAIKKAVEAPEAEHKEEKKPADKSSPASETEKPKH